ncbi:Crp/Fnr family transcriptional regulator [Noviherbaspirillum massiliense]|uniref:Crp/Fnr family transcriptional regulator n=1 Tax=Noviherbaspirillum massiliense TaxID=1465823 RepID=UPI0002D542A0|nr:Crp/Fnr family transcriptional regulator [Noviherbaspirillum massiliense]
MTWLEMIGYVASGLTFATFYMRAMLPLRYIALCSNVCFIVYGYFAHLPPVLLLHTFLLPLNATRLLEMRRLLRQVQLAERGEVSVEALLPFATRRRVAAGEVLFRKGEPARELYFVLEGVVHVEEVQMDIGPGQMAGVIGVFSPEKERPWNAVFKTDGEVLVLSQEKVMQSFCENPRFGLSLARLITKRAIVDLSRRS